VKAFFASLSEIDRQRAQSGKSYREFLRVPAMSAGFTSCLPEARTCRGRITKTKFTTWSADALASEPEKKIAKFPRAA
jgi:hypothetical protein